MTATSELLRAIALRHVTPETASWLERGLSLSATTFTPASFFGVYASIGRRAPNAAFALSADEAGVLAARGISKPETWTLAELLRASLLLYACERIPAVQHVALIKDAFLKGDNGERCAVLKSLMLLPEPARFEWVATEACRTNVVDVFRAIACHNGYPALCFSDISFNQLVIKALFLEVPIVEIMELSRRSNPELTRMARDYAAERSAAGRVVTPDTKILMESPT